MFSSLLYDFHVVRSHCYRIVTDISYFFYRGVKNYYTTSSSSFFPFQRRILIFLLGNDLFLPSTCSLCLLSSSTPSPCRASLAAPEIVILRVRIISFYFATIPCYFYPARFSFSSSSLLPLFPRTLVLLQSPSSCKDRLRYHTGIIIRNSSPRNPENRVKRSTKSKSSKNSI